MIDIIYRCDPELNVYSPLPATAAEAKRLLEEGNQRFSDLLTLAAAEGHVEPQIIPLDLFELGGAGAAGTAIKQAPFAIILGCSDARAPTELVFGQAYNELFVVRVAGNVLGSECLGSIDYAMAHLGKSLKLVVVLGHTGCGAVTATVDAYLTPANYLSLATSHALRGVIDRISIAVRAASRTLETVYDRDVSSRPGYRQVLIETTAIVHAALTAHTLEQEFAGKTECQVVYGIFDLVTRRVGLSAGTEAETHAQLHESPRDRESFVELLTGIVARPRMRDVLDGLDSGAS